MKQWLSVVHNESTWFYVRQVKENLWQLIAINNDGRQYDQGTYTTLENAHLAAYRYASP